MFNIGGGEILVIALIALIAVGPEQLPGVMRKVGAFVGQVRGMTTGLRDEFMSGVDEMKAGVDELNPDKWMGDGSADKPIVPRGYAENTIKTTVGPKASSEETSDAAARDKPAQDSDEADEADLVEDGAAVEDDPVGEDRAVSGDSAVGDGDDPDAEDPA